MLGADERRSLCTAAIVICALGCVWTVQKPPATPNVLQIPRFDASNLSVAFFRSNFLGKRPVIISSRPLQQHATPAEIADNCPQLRMPVKRPAASPELWAGLQSVGEMPIRNLVAAWAAGHRELYGFEGDIVTGCPALLDAIDFKLPPHFAGDSSWAESTTVWPSLLLGPAASGSALHVDKWGLPFWLFMLSGVKRFRIVTDADVEQHLAGFWANDLLGSTAAGFEPLDLFDPWVVAGVLRGATVWDSHLRAGDWLYIPQRAAHAAINDVASVAISANFMDTHSARLTNRRFSSSLDACGPVAGVWEPTMTECIERFRQSQAAAQRHHPYPTEDWVLLTDQIAPNSGFSWCFAKIIHAVHAGDSPRLLWEYCRSKGSLIELSGTSPVQLGRQATMLNGSGLLKWHLATSIMFSEINTTVELLHQAAQEGLLLAQAKLGEALVKGIAGPPNIKEGTMWLRKAVAQGAPEAQALLRRYESHTTS